MILHICSAFAFFTIAFSAQAGDDSNINYNKNSERIIGDPEQAFMQRYRHDAEAALKDDSIDKERITNNLVIIRVRGDFNNDGKPDEMLASSETVGNGGGPFELYLSDAHTGFHDVGSIAMSSSANIISLGQGSAKILSCWHMSARGCSPYGYVINRYDVRSIAKKDLPPVITNENEDSPASREFLNSNTSYDVCRWAQWLKNGHCEWHTWQELEKLDATNHKQK